MCSICTWNTLVLSMYMYLELPTLCGCGGHQGGLGITNSTQPAMQCLDNFKAGPHHPAVGSPEKPVVVQALHPCCYYKVLHVPPGSNSYIDDADNGQSSLSRVLNAMGVMSPGCRCQYSTRCSTRQHTYMMVFIHINGHHPGECCPAGML